MVRAEYYEFIKGSTVKALNIPVSASLLKIEIDSGSLQLTCKLTKNSNSVYGLCGIKSSDYSKSEVLGEGLWTVEVAGLSQVMFNYSGSGNVNVRLIY